MHRKSDIAAQAEKARRLRELHVPGNPLLLFNVWDAITARIVQESGADAIATTSSAIAWGEGYKDGEQLTRAQMLDRIQRIAAAVELPVTADLEAGYGDDVDAAVQTARGAIAAGAVGLNFEDRPVYGDDDEVRRQCERIRAMVSAGEEAGVPLVINARTDVYLEEIGPDDEWRVREAVRRGNLYLEAGAACIFVPGVSDEATIAALCAQIRGPVNVLLSPDFPPLARLKSAGVARISVGGAGRGHFLAQLGRVASQFHSGGDWDFAKDKLSHGEMNGLFDRGR